MGALLQFAFNFKTEECYKCGMAFAMSEDFQRRRINDKESFYCPAGHAQHYIGKSETEKLKIELEQEKKRTEWAKRDAEVVRQQRDHFERSAIAYKGAKTRLKNRVQNGVCPCCSRSFQNLKRHIDHKHPDYKGKDE